MLKLTVKEWRRAKGISQESMASMLGVHVNTYANYENNPQKISISAAEKIANILDVRIEDISFCPEAQQNVANAV